MVYFTSAYTNIHNLRLSWTSGLLAPNWLFLCSWIHIKLSDIWLFKQLNSKSFLFLWDFVTLTRVSFIIIISSTGQCGLWKCIYDFCSSTVFKNFINYHLSQKHGKVWVFFWFLKKSLHYQFFAHFAINQQPVPLNSSVRTQNCWISSSAYINNHFYDISSLCLH